MSSHWQLIGAILRKDVLSFWPLALCSMLLLAVHVGLDREALQQTPEIFRSLLPIVAYVAAALLIAAVIQADAPAGTRNEWLTRPVPRPVLFAAKAMFIAGALLVPTIAGNIALGLRMGASVAEIVLTATSLSWAPIVMVLTMCVVAVMTTTLIEAAVAAVAILAVVLFVVPVTVSLSGTGEEIYISGAAWLAQQPRQWFGLVVGGVLLWLMYWHRRTQRVRVLFMAAIGLLVVSPILMPWRPVFAAQKWLSPNVSAAKGVTLIGDGACLPAIRVSPPTQADMAADSGEPAWSTNSAPVVLSGRLWSPAQRQEAGTNAIGFESRIALSGAPYGWRVLVARVDAVYRTSEGRVVLHPARFTPTLRQIDSGTQLVSHYWLLPREESERLSQQQVQLVLDYSLSLLRPVQSANLEVDGKRRVVEGFGYCAAQFDRATSTIEVECFKRGSQPGQITANLVGASADVAVPSGSPDYTPAVLEMLGGMHHTMTLRNVPQDRAGQVTLTSYEPQAHFDREVTLPGLIGASTDACPLPRP